MADVDLAAINDAIAELRARCNAVALTASGLDEPISLTSDEERVAADFVPLRRMQFSRGRVAARAALRSVGAAETSIGSSDDGAPLFSRGIVGSISHKESWAVAAIASTSSIRYLGVDLEFDDARDEDDLLARVCTPNEVSLVDRLQQAGLRSPGTWLLSAKETIYKALFASGARFDFEDVELSVNTEHSTFEVAKLSDLAVPELAGHYAHRGRWLVCLAFVVHKTSFDNRTSRP